MNALNELKALINQVSELSEAEQQSLKEYEAYRRGENRRKIIDRLNTLSFEKNSINNELTALNEELNLIVFKQEELQKREAQLYERLNIVESELEKIVQVYDLLNAKSCKLK